MVKRDNHEESEKSEARIAAEQAIDKRIAKTRWVQRGLAGLGLSLGVLAGMSADQDDATFIAAYSGTVAASGASYLSRRSSNRVCVDVVEAYRKQWTAEGGSSVSAYGRTSLEIVDGHLVERYQYDSEAFPDGATTREAAAPFVTGVGGLWIGATANSNLLKLPESAVPSLYAAGAAMAVGGLGLHVANEISMSHDRRAFHRQLDNIDNSGLGIS